MSLEELLDFILRFLARSWISYASVGARNNDFFWICMFNKMSVSGRGWFYFCRKGFSNFWEKIVKIFTIFLAFSVFKKPIILLGFVCYCYYFIDKLPCFLYIMMEFLESLFIIILFGDFFWVGKLISVSFVFSNNIWVVCSQLLSVEGILFCNCF